MQARIPALVSSGWLAQALSRSPAHLRVLDSTWYVNPEDGKPKEEYLAEHIPSALFFDIEECRDKNAKVKVMLPSPDHFASYVERLGICNQTHVVVYDTNQPTGILSSARVWWMFRINGHHKVSVLDGGLSNWLKEGHPTTSTIDPVTPAGQFKVKFEQSLVKSFEQMEKNLDTHEFQVMDARSAQRFNGLNKVPKGGHMPHAINIPYPRMMCPHNKVFKEPDELREVFHSHGVDLEHSLVATCGGGISACILALGAYLCGKEDVAVYDGSWAEWMVRAKPESKL